MRNDMATILPPELKHHIAHFCKPAELAILALVHKSYRDEAEPLLYKEVVVYLGSETVPKVLDTLKTRPHKAIMVQSMKIEFARRWRSHGSAASASALDLLCAAFVNMHALSDLRLHLHREDTTFQNSVSTILCDGVNESALHSFQLISEEPSNLTMFTFSRDTFLPQFNVLSVFPAFSTVSWDTIAKSYDDDNRPPMSMIMSRTTVDYVRIYFSDGHDAQYHSNFVAEMIKFFPEITSMELLFHQTPEEPYGRQTSSIVTAVTGLLELRVAYWSSTTRYNGPSVDYSSLAKLWSHLCPHLHTVSFLDMSFVRRHEGMEWDD